MTGRSLPPVTWLALAYATGAGLLLGGAPFPPAPLSLVLLLAPPLWLWLRPGPPAALLAAFLAGALWTGSWLDSRSDDCRLHLEDGARLMVEGRFEGRPEADGAVPLRLEGRGEGECAGIVRAFLRDDEVAAVPLPGELVRVGGEWRAGRRGDPLRPEWAGYLAVEELEAVPEAGVGRRPVLRFRGAVQKRIAELFGPSTPLVDALLLARREALDPELREAFVLSGTAHLLAISGFHVGVISALIFGLTRLLGVGRNGASGAASAGCWLYVLLIGFPYAATRAAAIVTVLAVGRIRGRPVDSAGALATAFLVLLVADPGALAGVGFQLSFAGAGGLVFLYRPLRDWLSRRRRISLPGYVAAGLAAGVAATLPTLPLVAWHFDRTSLVGIPVTLVMAPLVSAVLPGILAVLTLDLVWTPGARFLAGGVHLLLDLTTWMARAVAGLPGVAPWVPRGWFAAVPVGAVLAAGALRVRDLGRRLRPAFRWLVLVAGAAVAVLLWPLGDRVIRGERLEIHVVDVGQGDGVALRSPAGRWLVVDAGPRSESFDAGERRMVPHLRRAGARRVEAVVMSHPHLDHIGGVPAILENLEVPVLVDPGWVTPSRPWLEILRQVEAGRVGWWTPRQGDSFQMDGVRVDVLHPDTATLGDPTVDDPNEISLILLIRWRNFAALLTGDAYGPQEAAVLPLLEEKGGVPLDLLKVGHHGSRTSTSAALLDAAEPRKAAVSLGRRNLYGHPHREVTDRLVAREIPLYRTDRDGTVVVRSRPGGGVRVLHRDSDGR